MKAWPIALLYLLMTSGCEVFDIDVDRATETERAASITYTGDITTTQGESTLRDNIDFSFASDTDPSGTFFRKSDGAVAMFSGERSGSTVSFTGSIDSFCPGSIDQGTLRETGSAAIEISLEGTDCNGPFTTSGRLDRTPCIDLSGWYVAEESAEFSCTIGGETEVFSAEGSAELMIVQSGCRVGFSVPGIGITREGSIDSKTLSLAGPFVAAAADGLSTTENEFKASVDISDNYLFTFEGDGKAVGTVDGEAFSCTGTSSGTLTRKFDVAVALLEGGAFSIPDISGTWQDVEDHIQSIDPKRVLVWRTKGGGNQIGRAEAWLNRITNNGLADTRTLLIGHSAGGHALVEARFQQVRMDTRITLDPVEPNLLDRNQSDRTVPIAHREGRFVNFRAQESGFLDLKGYAVEQADHEQEIPLSNHNDIVDFAWQVSRTGSRSLIAEEVDRLLNAAGKSEELPFNPMFEGRQSAISFVFGWQTMDTPRPGSRD